MEPFRMYDLLFWQNHPDDLYLHHGRTYRPAVFHKLDLNLILPGFYLLRHFHVNPQASPLTGTYDNLPVLYVPQKIRI